MQQALKIYIKTYGCQMNERDSEALSGMLSQNGHIMVDSENEADVLIFNTCSVRDQAERKAVGKVGFMKKLKLQKPHLIIGIIGCMAQNKGDELFKELPHLDFVVGTGELHTLPKLIETLQTERRQIAALNENSEVLTAMGTHYTADHRPPVSAYVAITRGCNRFCSYCIVPYVRGREISREIPDIIQEVNDLVEQGVAEIMLLGQNVAAFGLNGNTSAPAEDNSPFAELLEALCKIDKLKRIRFTSPYPTYFNRRLIDVIADNPKICRNIHLPLQSGSDRILKAMNRQYTSEQYWKIASTLRERIADLTFSTDVIVGFPGETEEDFQQTRDLMNKVNFEHAFIFKYSPRSGTVAAELEDQLSLSVKEERNQILLADLERRAVASNQADIGKVVEVMLEGPSRRYPQRWTGRTSNNKAVMLIPPAEAKIGDLVFTKIGQCSQLALYSENITDRDVE